MDRTIIMPYRAKEKELSYILYNAIQGLILLHPPTEELRNCLTEDMFIKPNQKAFFHIMHYLFSLLDPQEFKKRFFWPITDKRSESDFRTSTVEYLKHINKKYQMNWNNIRSYLVVMPGGMKFISFLLDFVNFIVKKLIKQKAKQLNLDANIYRSKVSEANLSKMCAKNELFKGIASGFIDALENVIAKYDDKSQKLMQHLEILSQESGLSVDLLTDEKFLEGFGDSNCRLFDKYYSDRSKKVFEMDNLISELKESTDKFYSKETGYKYDKQRICLQLERIGEHYPIDALVDETLGSKITNEGININTLISAFNVINVTIRNELDILNKEPCTGEFVYSRLLSLKKEFQEMEEQITNFKEILFGNMKKSKTELSKTPISNNVKESPKLNFENTLLMKLVSTPPIKFELPEGGGKKRLALVDSEAASAFDDETTFNNFLASSRSSTIRQQNRHHSLVDQTTCDSNSTINRWKIIDPRELLRLTSKKDSSICKTTTTKADISSLRTNWKLHQRILNDNDEEATNNSIALSIAITPKTRFKSLGTNNTSPQSFTKTASVTMLHQSPITPFISNDCTKISRSQYQLNSNDIGGDKSSGSPSLNYVKKLSAVRKVQDASLNFANLSTSPSGRLEPLVTADRLDIPKLKLNDVSLFEHNPSANNSFVYEKPKLVVNSPIKKIAVNVENNCNSGNANNNKIANKYEQEEDALCNISDSVLKDVTL